MNTTLASGSLVMMAVRTARPASKFPRVIHRLVQVKDEAVVCRFVTACGRATAWVEPATEGAPRCGRCWKP